MNAESDFLSAWKSAAQKIRLDMDGAFQTWLAWEMDVARMGCGDVTRDSPLTAPADREAWDEFAAMHRALCAALAAEPQDFLGQIYMAENLGRRGWAQVFTPLPLAREMAEMTIVAAKKIDPVFTVYDPAVGAGACLIASVWAAWKHGWNIGEMAFFGKDIDARCVCMSFIQLSFLGVAACVIWGDTLKNENWDIYRNKLFMQAEELILMQADAQKILETWNGKTLTTPPEARAMAKIGKAERSRQGQPRPQSAEKAARGRPVATAG